MTTITARVGTGVRVMQDQFMRDMNKADKVQWSWQCIVIGAALGAVAVFGTALAIVLLG